VTTEAVLWEWLNGLSDASTRGVAAEGLPPGPCGRLHRGGTIPARVDRVRCATLSDEARQELEPYRLLVFCRDGEPPSDGRADHRWPF
jgi:hypothetical protein